MFLPIVTAFFIRVILYWFAELSTANNEQTPNSRKDPAA